MTGPEHYRAAEQLLAGALWDIDGGHTERAAPQLTAAHVHATLALAAATALQPSNYAADYPEYAEWAQVAGTKQPVPAWEVRR